MCCVAIIKTEKLVVLHFVNCLEKTKATQQHQKVGAPCNWYTPSHNSVRKLLSQKVKLFMVTSVWCLEQTENAEV